MTKKVDYLVKVEDWCGGEAKTRLCGSYAHCVRRQRGSSRLKETYAKLDENEPRYCHLNGQYKICRLLQERDVPLEIQKLRERYLAEIENFNTQHKRLRSLQGIFRNDQKNLKAWERVVGSCIESSRCRIEEYKIELGEWGRYVQEY